MPLTLGSVFEQTKKTYHLELVAGEAGLYRTLRWLYFTEDIASAFMQGGELVVITGFSFQEKNQLGQLVRDLIARNACGLILNVGKYIHRQDITGEVLALCNVNRFPLILMPWERRLADIMQDYSHRIFSYTHAQDRLIYLFQTMLTDPRLYTSDDAAQLQAAGYQPKGFYTLAVLTFQAQPSSEQTTEELTQPICTMLENELNRLPIPAGIFSFQGRQLVLFHSGERELIARYMHRVLELCGERFPTIPFTCGVGTGSAGVWNLSQSFRTASAALTFAQFHQKPLAFFDEMGVDQLFFLCEDPELLERFTHILAPLEIYDAQHESRLLETLRVYLCYDGSVNLVADQLFCHRNTINYRIRKIKELLGSELDGSDMIFQLQMAFYVREYQRMTAPE